MGHEDGLGPIELWPHEKKKREPSSHAARHHPTANSRSPFGAILAPVRRVEQVGRAGAPAALGPVFFGGEGDGGHEKVNGVDGGGNGAPAAAAARRPAPSASQAARTALSPPPSLHTHTDKTHRPSTRSGPTSPNCICVDECRCAVSVVSLSVLPRRGGWTGQEGDCASVVWRARVAAQRRAG
jgi:hypothetical protein